MTEGEKEAIDFFIHECEKYDGTVEIKRTSVGEETRILNTVVKFLKLAEKQQKELEQEKEKNKELETENFSLNEMKRYNKKHYIHKDKIKEVFDRKLKNIVCEKVEVNYNTNDIHYQYWDCFESVLLNMKKELLEE